MILSAHQPNFIPWVPFFQKMKESDIFVILGNVQFEQGGYQNRFSINNKWYTMSVNKKFGENINDKTYLNPIKDYNTIIRKLPQYSSILDMMLEYLDSNLFNSNVRIIDFLYRRLYKSTKLINYDYPTTLSKTDRLIDLCIKYNADTYLSGIGAKKYLEIDKFYENNISVIFQDESSMIKNHILEVL